jgi:hypothetical protein
MVKQKKMWDWINREFEEWQKAYPEVEIPKNIRSKKKRDEWLNNVFLAKDGEELLISGGGRILLWLAYRQIDYPLKINTSWIKFIKYQEKRGRKDHILDAMKFQHREKKCRVKLLGNIMLKNNPDVILQDIDTDLTKKGGDSRNSSTC